MRQSHAYQGLHAYVTMNTQKPGPHSLVFLTAEAEWRRAGLITDNEPGNARRLSKGDRM